MVWWELSLNLNMFNMSRLVVFFFRNWWATRQLRTSFSVTVQCLHSPLICSLCASTQTIHSFHFIINLSQKGFELKRLLRSIILFNYWISHYVRWIALCLMLSLKDIKSRVVTTPHVIQLASCRLFQLNWILLCGLNENQIWPFVDGLTRIDTMGSLTHSLTRLTGWNRDESNEWGYLWVS